MRELPNPSEQQITSPINSALNFIKEGFMSDPEALGITKLSPEARKELLSELNLEDTEYEQIEQQRKDWLARQLGKASIDGTVFKGYTTSQPKMTFNSSIGARSGGGRSTVLYEGIISGAKKRPELRN